MTASLPPDTPDAWQEPPPIPAGPDYPQGSPQPGDSHPRTVMQPDRHRLAGRALRAAVDHLGELDHAHLPLPNGDDVEIVTVAEVSAWLSGLAVRVEAGEPL